MTEDDRGELTPADTADFKRADDIRAHYAAIVESSHDAIVAKNLDGVITAWNLAAQRMFGYSEHEAVGRPITMIIPPELHEEEHDMLRRVRAGERIDHYETVRVTKAGARIDVSLTISPVRDSGGTIIGCSKIARDITQVKAAAAALQHSEKRLRESEERFRLIANTAPVMIWITDVDGHVTYVNDTYLDFAGLPLPAASRDGWMKVTHPDDVEQCRDEYVKAVAQREPFQMEQRLRRRDGEYRWALSTGVPRYDGEAGFVGYIGTAVDITERKLADAALSTVSQKLIEAHEEEKARIARELHDDVNQRLALLKVRLDCLRQGPPASAADLQRQIGGVSRHIADLAADIHAMAHGLHPAKLELIGLERAAAGLCEELSKRHGVAIEVHVGNIPKELPVELSLCLYRVLQEALQNVVKHGGSRRASVSLNSQRDTVNLTVKDSGTGFDPHEAVKGPGLGLTSMRERLKVVGGQLSVHSERGRGTTIHAVAPVHLPTSYASAGR